MVSKVYPRTIELYELIILKKRAGQGDKRAQAILELAFAQTQFGRCSIPKKAAELHLTCSSLYRAVKNFNLKGLEGLKRVGRPSKRWRYASRAFSSKIFHFDEGKWQKVS
jgi:hypothetical protein